MNRQGVRPMDAGTLRNRLREASAELEQLETRREALMSIIKGYESLIRLSGPGISLRGAGLICG